MGSQYEFTEQQNEQIGSFVAYTRGLAMAFVLGGSMLFSLVFLRAALALKEAYLPGLDTLGTVFAVLVVLWLATSLFEAASKFQLVVDTEGSDIEHLMEGLRLFERFFSHGSRVMWALTLFVVVLFGYTGFGGEV